MKKLRKKKKKPTENPRDLRLFQELCRLVEETGMEVRVEKGNFRGGSCVIEGEKRVLFINKKFPLEKQIEFLLTEIREKSLLPEGIPEDVKTLMATS